MMAFAMQNKMHSKMMWMMEMKCVHSDWKKCHETCHKAELKNIIVSSNINLNKKIIKTKIFSFIDIFSNTSSKFLENIKLIKNTSPPNLQKEIKYYSYSDLVKIIKSNT